MATENTTSKKGAKGFFRSTGNKIKNFFTYNVPGKRPRVWELDLMRGIIMLVVTFDHCCMFTAQWGIIPYQTSLGLKIMEFAQWYCDCDFRSAIQPFGLFFLCFLSGINCQFTRSGFKRVFKFWILGGVFMGSVALLYLLMPEQMVTPLMFNIIAVLTISFTFWAFLDLIKCPTWIRSGIGIILICIGMTAFYKHFIQSEDFYIENKFLALMVYNEHGLNMSTRNFEPLLPHMGWFIIGGVVGKFAYKNKVTHCKQTYPPRYLYPVLIVGKHSLFFYILGPVIVLGPVWIIVKLVSLFL